MNLETIHKDCLDNILKYTNVSSIIYLSRTNKYFNNITKDFPYKCFVEKYKIQENTFHKAKNNKELVYNNKKLFCENCDKYIGKKRVFSVRQLVLINGVSMYACLDCRYTYVKKNYKLIKNKDKITETEAMFEYFIPCAILEYSNINFENIIDNVLIKKYNKNDIVKLSYAYHGTSNIIPEARKKKISVYDVNILNCYNIKDENFGVPYDYYPYFYTPQEFYRKTQLLKALCDAGLILRNDSLLCKKYINENVGDIKHIVNTMIEMNWLFKETNYSTLRYINGVLDSKKGKKLAIDEWCYYNYDLTKIPKTLIKYVSN